jgi:hypothetical protein
MSFNVHKDFAGLDIPAEGCPERVWLCPACAVEYMNSFNRRGDRKKGKEESTSQEWTVERLLEFLKTAG